MKTKQPKTRYLTPVEAAQVIGCSRHYVRIMIKRGRLPAEKVDTSSDPHRNQYGYEWRVLLKDAEYVRDNPPKSRGRARGCSDYKRKRRAK